MLERDGAIALDLHDEIMMKGLQVSRCILPKDLVVREQRDCTSDIQAREKVFLKERCTIYFVFRNKEERRMVEALPCSTPDCGIRAA